MILLCHFISSQPLYPLGVAQKVTIEGEGKVRWSVLNQHGSLCTLTVPALYVPKSSVRLLSISHLLQEYQGKTIQMSHKGLEMSSIPGDSARRPLLIQLNLNTNLLTSYGFVDQGVSSATNNLMAMVTCVDDANANLSGPECEWLKWHNRLGHMSFRKIQFLMRSGVLAHTEATRHVHTAICKLTSPPMCAACHYG